MLKDSTARSGFHTAMCVQAGVRLYSLTPLEMAGPGAHTQFGKGLRLCISNMALAAAEAASGSSR